MAQEQWYMAIGGHQVGPVSQDDVVTSLRNGTIDGTTLVFTAGLSNWTALKDVPQLAAFHSANRAPTPPPPLVPGRRAHEIDFKILGSEMQFVEVIRSQELGEHIADSPCSFAAHCKVSGPVVRRAKSQQF